MSLDSYYQLFTCIQIELFMSLALSVHTSQ